MKNKRISPYTLYHRFLGDERITVWHLALYSAILLLWRQHGYPKQIPVTRALLMKMAHVRSFMTYHKCLNQLQVFGYLLYFPTYDSYTGSHIEICGLER